jgi:hypothetical protein
MDENQLIDTSRLSALPAAALRLAPAEVIRVDQRRLLVSFGVQQVEAQSAVLDYEPSPGDRLLIVGDDESGFFAIGVLDTVRPRPKLKLQTSDTSGATILCVEEGDLEVLAPRGAIRMVATTGLEATTMGPIHLQSQVSVGLSILDRLGKKLRRIRLTRRSAELQHERIEVAADVLQLAATRSSVTGAACRVDVDDVSLTARRGQVDLGSLLSKVGNAYHQVAGLWQLVADRTRMVVKGTSHHMAQRLYSKADDVKVKADKIHLG